MRIWKATSLPPNWFKRTQETDEEANAQTEENVKAIIRKVVKEGDIALVELTEKFDKSKLTPATLRVTRSRNQESLQCSQQRADHSPQTYEEKS